MKQNGIHCFFPAFANATTAKIKSIRVNTITTPSIMLVHVSPCYCLPRPVLVWSRYMLLRL